jgi:hypothetical protein
LFFGTFSWEASLVVLLKKLFLYFSFGSIF